MIKLKRNEEIRKKFERNTSVKDLTKQYHLSKTRIHIILKSDKKYCGEHKMSYYTNCFQCTKNHKLEKFLKSKRYNMLKKKIVEISERGRKEKSFDVNRKVIRELRDKYSLSFDKIGRLLKRDHSTIYYHYYLNK